MFKYVFTFNLSKYITNIKKYINDQLTAAYIKKKKKVFLQIIKYFSIKMFADI